MSDGIKFLIELDGKTAGAKDAVKGLHDVEHAADSAEHSLSALAKKEFPNLSRDIFTAEAAIEGLKLGAELAMKGIEVLGGVIKETIKTIAGEQRTNSVFKGLLGEDSEETIEYLEKFSELSEFTEDQVKGFGAELARAGYKGDNLKDALEGIADAATLSLNPLEAAQGAAAAFAKMQRTGKVDRMVLKELQLDPREISADLASSLGMTKEAVKKALDQGTIPAADAFRAVLDAIGKKTGKSMGEAGLTMGNGLEAGITHLKELPDRIMMGVTGSQGMKDLEDGIAGMLKVFNPESETGKAMIGGLSELIGEVGKAFKDLDWKEVGRGVKDLTDDLTALIGPLATIAKGVLFIADALHQMGERIGDAAADGSIGKAFLEAIPSGGVVSAAMSAYGKAKNHMLGLTGDTGPEALQALQEQERKKQNDANYQAFEDRLKPQLSFLPKEARPASALSPIPALSALPPLSSAPVGATGKVVTNHVGAPQVTVNLYGPHGDAQATGEAAGQGAAKATEEIMSHSIERISSMAGLGN